MVHSKPTASNGIKAGMMHVWCNQIDSADWVNEIWKPSLDYEALKISRQSMKNCDVEMISLLTTKIDKVAPSVLAQVISSGFIRE